MITDFNKALAGTNAFLIKNNITREELWREFLDTTSRGSRIVNEGGDAEDLQLVLMDDGLFIRQVIIGLQERVFGIDNEHLMSMLDTPWGVDLEPGEIDDVDGWYGTETHQRRLKINMAMFEHHWEETDPHEEGAEATDWFLYNGKQIGVQCPVISPGEEGALVLNGGHAWPAGQLSNCHMLAVEHEDVCGSVKSLHRVLNKRGYLTIGGIARHKPGEPAVFYQFYDPAKKRGVHAGTKANMVSVTGIDFNSLVKPKYLKRYRVKGLECPLIKIDYHHYRKRERLGVGTGQLITNLEIMRALSIETGIPYTRPTDENGDPIMKVLKGSTTPRGRKGHLGLSGRWMHMNLTTNRSDNASVPWQEKILLMMRPDLWHRHAPLVESYKLDSSHAADQLAYARKNWDWPELL